MLKCRAKINLTLDVDRPREDGMHPLRSIMQTVELHDILEARRGTSGGIQLSVSGPQSREIPTDESNLVVKAVTLLDQSYDLGIARNGIAISLIKNIPSQAGLGGGSSNAASALLAVAQIFEISASMEELSRLARVLGSDVPFFLSGGTALVEGTGEKCHQIAPPFPPYPVVIAIGKQGVSTKQAYHALDAVPDRRPGLSTKSFLKDLQSGVKPTLHNDFQDVVSGISPDVDRTLTLFGQISSHEDLAPALLSGSGASVFKLYKDQTHAKRDAEYLRSHGQNVFLTALANTATPL